MKQGTSRKARVPSRKTQGARSMLQDTRESLVFARAFLSETQAVARPEAEDAAQVTQILEWAAESRAELSSDTLRRLITRMEDLAKDVGCKAQSVERR